jgi:hypothetical protein
MKQSCIILFYSLFAVSIVNTQPILNASDLNPIIGEKYVMKRIENLNPGYAGENMFWDFSSIMPLSEDTMRFIETSTEFPLSNIAKLNGKNHLENYRYLNIDNTKWTLHGTRFDASKRIYNNPIDLLIFPLSFGSIKEDTYNNLLIKFNQYPAFNEHGTYNYKVDGYGTLITPAGTFTDVLRVKSIMENISVEDNNLYTKIETYSWYKSGIHCEIATIAYTYSGSVTYSKGFYIEKTFLNAKNEEKNDFSIFPNPTNVNFTINIANGLNFDVILTDLFGKEMDINVEKTLGQINVFTGSIPSGLYLLKLVNKVGEVFVRKIKIE